MQTIMTMEPNEMYNHVMSATSRKIMLTHRKTIEPYLTQRRIHSVQVFISRHSVGGT